MSTPRCAAAECDIFDFMARHVGLTVIHPGGMAATARLAEACSVSEHDRVLDLGCGKGTTAVYLARTFGCHVTGIDLSPDLVAHAENLARRARVSSRTRFVVADAHALPHADGEFDVVVSQAVLVLVRNKTQVIREALRVTRAGGRLGWLELTWRREPSPEFLQATSDVLCASCMRSVETSMGWQSRLQGAGIADLVADVAPLPGPSLRRMLRDEGAVNATAVALRTLLPGSVRARTRLMGPFFAKHADTFGYGLYVGRKPAA